MLLGDKINVIAPMKNIPESSSHLVHKLGHYERYERELSKLKFHLKMKKRIYEDTQFKNINERLNFCEAYFKKQKYRMMREEADKILCDSRKLRVNTYNQMRDKLELSKKTRIKAIDITDKADQKSEHFKVNVHTQQSSMSESRVVMQYELTPIIQKKLSKQLQKRKIKTTTDQKQQNERYVSQFQKKIKEQLSKISFIKNGHQSKSEDQASQVEYQNRFQHMNLKPMKPNGLTPIVYYSPNRIKQVRQESIRNNATSQSKSSVHRYLNLKNSLVNNRRKLKDQQKREIAKIRDEQTSFLEKSRVLKNIISKYDYRQKNKDDEALQLMCQATLARADALLQS